ncbi:MAG: response regulator [Flavobacterium sp.]|nr:MAG: response regulator [Flavobacterium sp.]
MTTSKLLYYLDDDLDDLEFFKDAAEELGHQAVIFRTGQDMLQSLRIEEDKPDAIFLDIHMPILNGAEILQILKNSKDWKNFPVVMISGAYPKKLVRHFQDAGADFLMKKPPSGEFKNVLEQALSETFSRKIRKTA